MNELQRFNQLPFRVLEDCTASKDSIQLQQQSTQEQQLIRAGGGGQKSFVAPPQGCSPGAFFITFLFVCYPMLITAKELQEQDQHPRGASVWHP